MDDFSNHPSAFTFAKEPLSIVKGDDGKEYLTYPEGNELYGFIAGDTLTMYNDPMEDTLRGMMYKVKDIERVTADDVGMVKIALKTGDTFTHQKRAGGADEYEIIQPPVHVPADENDLWNTGRLIMRKYPNYNDCLYRDVLRDRIVIDCAMIGEPGKVVPYDGKNSVELAKIRNELETYTEHRTTENGKTKEIRFKSHKENTNDAIKLLADSNLRNPFIERIKRVHWDGVNRVDTFLYDAGCRSRVLSGDDDYDYTLVVSRGIFLSILERNLCDNYRSIKFIPIIIGEQDAGKTTLCEKIGLGKEPHWYRSTKASFDDEKRFYESVQGCVVAELKEGAQLKKNTVESIKSFADDTVLQYRKSYGSDASSRLIRFTMIITTNEEQVLSDASGNVRFYPVYMS